MDCKLIQFSQKGDERGSLIVLESQKEIPFDIKRVFYMLNTTKGTVRGQHANRYSDFVLVNIRGQVTIHTHDGINETSYVLDKPDEGIYIPHMIWKEMSNFSEDSILLVLSNMPYQEHEYLRDFESFKFEVNRHA